MFLFIASKYDLIKIKNTITLYLKFDDNYWNKKFILDLLISYNRVKYFSFSLESCNTCLVLKSYKRF